MVFEATVQERNVIQNALRGPLKALLVLSVGLFIGLMLAEMPERGPSQGDFLVTGDIPGEDWHGNVRRSSPAH
ncbi:MAG: hypothetical protein R8G34_22255 [Paracoccaceae bacterium]|nr:hypothetical protein [Paracoccaceae bacterium]